MDLPDNEFCFIPYYVLFSLSLSPFVLIFFNSTIEYH